MSNKLFLYERGHFTEPERCSLWQKISILCNSCQYSYVIARVGFNIDRVTTQHTPKCVENCSDNKVSIIVLLTPTRFSVSLVITLNTAFLLNRSLIICFEAVVSMCTDRDVSINKTKILVI